MATISGTMTDNCRVIIIKESNWSVESNTTVSGSSYSVTGLTADKKLFVARKSDGEIVAHGDVSPT
jgi:hypothetical protein